MTLNLIRRLMVIVTLTLCMTAQADYPEKPTHRLIGFPAGGGADLAACRFSVEANNEQHH